MIACIGVGTGVLVGFASARVIGKYLVDMQLPGAPSLIASELVILAAVVIASALPAARAARVDVVQALHSE